MTFKKLLKAFSLLSEYSNYVNATYFVYDVYIEYFIFNFIFLALRAVVVAKLVKLGISPLTSIFLALRVL